MGSTYCLRILFALFPACVTCLGNYGGSMPTADVRRVSAAQAFPVIGPEAKQTGNLNNPSYNSVYRALHQGTYGRFDGFKESLSMGSNVKDSKDCQTKSDNQENMINFRPSASVSKYDFSSGQPSAQYESRTATKTFTNVQPSSRLASTLSQSGSTLMSSLEVPESSYVAKMTGSVVWPSNNAYNHVDVSAGVRDPLARGPNFGSTSISSEMSHQYALYQGSKSTNKLQKAGSSYGPVLKGTSLSNVNPKPSSSGLAYTNPKPSIVSSGPIFVVRDGENTRGHGVYSGTAGSAKPSDVGHYQVSQFSRDATLIGSSQVKSWNEPLQNFVSGVQYSPILERRKASESQCRNNVAKSTASSGETLLKAPESAQRNKLLSTYENTRFKFQQTYNTRDPPNQAFKPNYPSQSGVQQHFPKPSIASSGAILMMQAPTNVQSGTESGKVPPSFPEHKVTFASGPNAHQYQPFQATQNSRNVQPDTSTYVGSSQTGYHALSSVKRIPYKPISRPLNPSSGFANNPNIAGSNEINTVRVRLNKLPTSSFGNFQNQWASGGISSGTFQSSSPQRYLGQRPSQNVQTPVIASVPQYHGYKGVQSQYVVTQGNAESSRQITAIPSEFGQGAIRRLSSNYRQAEQEQVNTLDSLVANSDVTQNSHAGLGQQDPVNFQ